MKRRSLLILAAIVFLATVFTLLPTSVVVSPVSAGENLIQNPGFEEPTGNGDQTPNDWTASTSSPYRDVSLNVHSGSYSAYLHGTSGSYTQTVGIGTGTIYRFEAYTKANATATETVTLQIRDSSAVVLDTHSWSGTNHGWARRIRYFTTPENAWDAVITLSISGDSAAAAWFDDILLEEKIPSECFIATAAYGTATAEQLDVLRAFRDQVLLRSPLGSEFVAWYYQASPPVADFIAESSPLRTLVRELLVDPVVGLAKLTRGVWGD